MISNETMFVVKPEGVERWMLTKEKVNARDSLASAFSEGLIRKSPAVTFIGGDYGHAGVALGEKYEVWSVRVLQMSLEAPYALLDGVHVPVFDSTAMPILPLRWKVPDGMKLVLAMTIMFHESNQSYFLGDHYLVAFDKDGRMYRLPISNVYQDCKLCHGQQVHYTKTTLELVSRACEQFQKSRWNADLYLHHEQPRTVNLFRFKPTEEGFEQLPPVLEPGKDWTSLCDKVAVEKLSKLIQPVL